MHKFYKSVQTGFRVLFCLFLISNCVPKPIGLSFVDATLFSNYFISNSSLPLKVQVQGLASGASFQISNHNSETLTISSNGEFEFTKKLQRFSNFTVSIERQPSTSPNQTCVITNPTGSVSPDTNLVEINCGTSFFNVNVNVFGIASGATGSLSIRNGSVDTLSIGSDGNYAFSAQVPDTGNYSVVLLSSPSQHNCVIEALPPSAGTINNAPVTLNVNCLSLTNASPVNQTAINVGDTIQFTFSKPVTPLSCSLTAPTPTPSSGACASDLAPFANPITALSYAGNTVSITPNVSWPGGLGQCIQLSGCTEAGTNRPFQITSPIRYGVTSQIKYVKVGGLAAGTCDTIANACNEIQYAITQCNTATPCFVMVSQGTYSMFGMGQRIILKDKLQLLGGFRNDFQARDSVAYPTIIRDDVGTGGCGASDFGTCTPIAGGSFTMTSNMMIQGFTIITNQFNAWGTGIWLSNLNTAGFSLIITGNLILGATDVTSAYGLFITKSAMYLYNVGPNLVVAGNYILGGSGNSISVGMRILEGTQGVISNNYINGGSHVNINDGLDFSLGIMVNNTATNTTQSLRIVNNIFNSHHITSATPVSVRSSAAVQALSINSPNFVFINNTMYGGNGTTRSYGIHQQSSPGNLRINVINNQVLTNPGATTSVCLNYDTNNVSATSNISGNNLIGCNTLATSNGAPYRLCGPEPSVLLDFFTCSFPLTNNLQLNFSHNPNFDAPTSATQVFRLSSSSPCNSVYGGVDPGFAPPVLQLYQSDLLGNTRTNNVAPLPVPLGSFGYSIGAFEVNGNCTP
ncbi:hypothetical protein [Leptospira yasudae]|uniref:Pectate lyase superfamily protein domain-containing protein n=1 Tax=Leptospira yasudae TaxID=2202201 RepID=A0ABX9M4M0_9LEPT|nr:hypothetical protein [Leptospira yasudae]RHX80626.1 hypothetical protein DLM77_06970 [Leptospira yasudae]